MQMIYRAQWVCFSLKPSISFYIIITLHGMNKNIYRKVKREGKLIRQWNYALAASSAENRFSCASGAAEPLNSKMAKLPKQK